MFCIQIYKNTQISSSSEVLSKLVKVIVTQQYLDRAGPLPFRCVLHLMLSDCHRPLVTSALGARAQPAGRTVHSLSVTTRWMSWTVQPDGEGLGHFNSTGLTRRQRPQWRSVRPKAISDWELTLGHYSLGRNRYLHSLKASLCKILSNWKGRIVTLHQETW